MVILVFADKNISIKINKDKTKKIVLVSYGSIKELIESTRNIKDRGLSVFVQDTRRGGIFTYDSTKKNQNNGITIFNGWVRHYSGDIELKWADVIPYHINPKHDNKTVIEKVLSLNKKIIIRDKYFVSKLDVPMGVDTINIKGIGRYSGFIGDKKILFYTDKVKNFIIDNLTFDNYKRVFHSCEKNFNNNDIYIKMKNNIIKNIELIPIYVKKRLKKITIEDNILTNCAGGFLFYTQNSIGKIKISNNTIEHVRTNQPITYAIAIKSAIRKNDTIQEDTEQIQIIGNYIKDIKGTLSNTKQTVTGIIIIGGHAIVKNNTIEDVGTKTSNQKADSFGIYAKIINSIISNNILKNAGSSGSIYLKSNNENEQNYQGNGKTGKLNVSDNIVSSKYIQKEDIGIGIEGNNLIIQGNQIYGKSATLCVTSENKIKQRDNIIINSNLIESDDLAILCLEAEQVTCTNNRIRYTGKHDMRDAKGQLEAYPKTLLYVGAHGAKKKFNMKNYIISNNFISYDKQTDKVFKGIQFGIDNAKAQYENVIISNNLILGVTYPINFANAKFKNLY
jgi:hypothetical protein